MSANGRSFEFVETGNGANTRIDYAFRDGEIIVRESIILEGKVDQSEIDELAESLPEGKFFSPQTYGMPDLLAKMPAHWVEESKDYLHHIERISYSPNKADEYAVSMEQFVYIAASAEMPSTWNTENSMS